ncbi:TPA: hypothetical protein ACRZRI_001005, partial [Legionella pneumophila]
VAFQYQDEPDFFESDLYVPTKHEVADNLGWHYSRTVKLVYSEQYSSRIEGLSAEKQIQG